MTTKISNLNLEKLGSYESDILLNKKLTNVSPSNMFEILFDCENFEEIFNIFLNKIKEKTNENFDVYVKNMWGYVQSNEENQSINFNIDFKNQITISSEYSFIYPIRGDITNVFLKKNGIIENIILNKGDMLILKTNDFIKEESDIKDRIAICGSISKIQKKTQIQKVLL